MTLRPIPAGTVRARCGCGWWICMPRDIGRVLCVHCGCRFMRATEKDFEAVGISTELELDYKKEKPPAKKGKRQKKTEGQIWQEGT